MQQLLHFLRTPRRHAQTSHRPRNSHRTRNRRKFQSTYNLLAIPKNVEDAFIQNYKQYIQSYFIKAIYQCVVFGFRHGRYLE